MKTGNPVHRIAFVLTLALLLTTAFLPASSHQPAAQAAAIDPKVYDALAASPDGLARFIVVFKDRADLSAAEEMTDWNERGRFVMERLQEIAARSQSGVLSRLSSHALPGRVAEFKGFWIANVITVTADRAAAEWLSEQPGVDKILPETKIDAPEPPIAAAPDADYTWGIEKIGANLVWSTYAIKGEGAVIGLVDTGVQWDHPALQPSYRGWNGATADHNYNWYDPAGLCSPGVPCDTNGHGTHTTGISAGGNSPAQGPIGVAPGAKWIMAAGCCASNASLLSSLQWMAAPTKLDGTAADPSKRPNVVNNSWGGPGGSEIFYQAIANLQASGIVPAFSAGNNGSGCGTLGSPGDNTVAFNVGSTTSSDGISSFSSRGPNPFTGDPSPEVSAPGDSIYSSVPTNSYTLMSGTSMAAPHVTGSVALIVSAEPKLAGKVDQIEEVLRKTAVKLTGSQTCGGVAGSQIPNSTFGWGRINVKAAVDFVWHAGTLQGTVTSAATGDPLAGATVSITRSGYTITQRTDGSGKFTFVAGAGSYDVSASAYGYNTASATGVMVTQNGVTTRDFALTSLSLGSISGKVLEGGDPAKPVAGALVALLPVSTGLSATTVADGSYTIANVPYGTQNARMTSVGYQTLTSSVSVSGAATLNFSPGAVADYQVGDSNTCGVPYSWIDATNGTLYNLGDDANVSVTLPWQFTFYGNAYNDIYVESNGLVTFGSGYTIWHGIIPWEGPPNNQIIGLGDDLNPAGGGQGKVYTKDLGDGRFVIEYYQVQHWLNGDPETFEIVLNKNDMTILVQYNTVSWPNFSNAGIENSDGSRGIQYTYNNSRPLVAGLAVKYTPFTGKPPASCMTAVAPVVSITKNGTTGQLRWTHLSPNAAYQVWRGTSPYFDPALGQGTQAQTLAATTGIMTYGDSGRIGDPAANYTWVVRGILAGSPSGPSNRVGEFDYSLTPGN